MMQDLTTLIQAWPLLMAFVMFSLGLVAGIVTGAAVGLMPLMRAEKTSGTTEWWQTKGNLWNQQEGFARSTDKIKVLDDKN